MRKCFVYQKNKGENVLSSSSIQPLPILQALFTNINMDFIEGLPKFDENEIILVVVDQFSK